MYPYPSAIKVKFLEDVKLEVTFQDGKVIQYDMSRMFKKYPQLEELRRNRKLFLSGKLDGLGDGIEWNDDLDFSCPSIYECGTLVGFEETTLNQKVGLLIIKTREAKGITQTQLSRLSKIDQGDISRIEQGLGNPTLRKISKIFDALGTQLDINSKWH